MYMICSVIATLYSWFVLNNILDLINSKIYMKYLIPNIESKCRIQITLTNN